MTIQVLGSGCPKCKKLYQLTRQAVAELGLDNEVEYITDVQKIIELGLMSSPVLVVDGRAVCIGNIPDIVKIKELISNKT